MPPRKLPIPDDCYNNGIETLLEDCQRELEDMAEEESDPYFAMANAASSWVMNEGPNRITQTVADVESWANDIPNWATHTMADVESWANDIPNWATEIPNWATNTTTWLQQPQTISHFPQDLIQECLSWISVQNRCPYPWPPLIGVPLPGPTDKVMELVYGGYGTAQKVIEVAEEIPAAILGWDWSAVESIPGDTPPDPMAYLDLVSGLIINSQNATYRGMCPGRPEERWWGNSGRQKKTINDCRYAPPVSSCSQTETRFKIAFEVFKCNKGSTIWVNVWISQARAQQSDYIALTVKTSEGRLIRRERYAGDHVDYHTPDGRWIGREYIWDIPPSWGHPIALYTSFKTLWQDNAPRATYGKNWCWVASGNSCYGWWIDN